MRCKSSYRTGSKFKTNLVSRFKTRFLIIKTKIVKILSLVKIIGFKKN